MNGPQTALSRIDAPAVVIGAGPAGLMAAEMIARGGHPVRVFDAMRSAGRKFLLAGIGGLNLTHSEPLAEFVGRYGEEAARLAPVLEDFGPAQLREWAAQLGVATFVGSSGRIFPAEMKAAPLLRAWLHRLRGLGVHLQMRHVWTGWDDTGALCFDTDSGPLRLPAPRVLVLALGGASWPQLGSDGAWVGRLAQRGVALAPLRPSNCGFDVAWSASFVSRFAGHAVKPVVLSHADGAGGGWRQQGEFVITATGVEGSLIYAASAALRDAIERDGQALIELDLMPGWIPARLRASLDRPRGRRSLPEHWRRTIGLSGVKANLVRESASSEDATRLGSVDWLADRLKRLPLRLLAARPVAEAISTAGGVRFAELDDDLMLKRMPGTYCVGEMLDWEAPTGGYLLTACFATGYRAGVAATARLAQQLRRPL